MLSGVVRQAVLRCPTPHKAANPLFYLGKWQAQLAFGVLSIPHEIRLVWGTSLITDEGLIIVFRRAVKRAGQRA